MKLVVNTVVHELAGGPEQTLLSVLREQLGLTAAKPGCGEGVCGACTVLVGGEPVRSCVTPRWARSRLRSRRSRGLAPAWAAPSLQQAFLELSAFQCGYCTPGMIMSAAALLVREPDPDEATIAAALEGNVCRCCTYPRIVRAARRATELEEVPYAPMEEPSFERPSRPWDLVPAAERDWFSVLPDGLVVAVEPEEWATSAGAWLHVEANGAVTPSPARSTSGRATGQHSRSSSPRSSRCRSMECTSSWVTPTSAPTTLARSAAAR